MARLRSLLTICASISLSLGAAIGLVEASHPHVRQHQVIARQDDPPVVSASPTLASTATTVTTPPQVTIPGVAINAIVPTASGQIGVNPPGTQPVIELHTSFTDEPMTVTLKGATTPTVAPALVTAVVADGFLNIGLAPKIADTLEEIAKQIPACGVVVKRVPAPVLVKVKGRQVAAPACGWDGLVSNIASRPGLVDWALLEAQLTDAVTALMNWPEKAAPHVIQLVNSIDMMAVWASLSSQQGLVNLGAGLLTWQLLNIMYTSLQLKAIPSMKAVAVHADAITKTETEYKTDDKCKKDDKDKPKCKKDDCKGDNNDFCTKGDQSGCPCKGSVIRQIGQMRPPAYADAFANLPVVPLFGKGNVIKAPECDSTARFNFPLNDWKSMALDFSKGSAKDLSKEAITAYNGTYKFTFGWFPKSGSKCTTTSVDPMLNYMVDDPSLHCREGSVDNTLYGSGKMETDCGTIKFSIKMSDNTVFVPPVLGDPPPPPVGPDPYPRWCYDPKTNPWTGKKVVKATLEDQAKKACKKFADDGKYQLKKEYELLRLFPKLRLPGDETDYIDGVLYGFRLEWDRERRGCSEDEKGGTTQDILPVEGDASCSDILVQAWEKCNIQYGGNMGGYVDVGCLRYSFRPDTPEPNVSPTMPPLIGGGDI